MHLAGIVYNAKNMMLQPMVNDLKLWSKWSIFGTNVQDMKYSNADKQISSELIALLRLSNIHEGSKISDSMDLSEFFNTRIYPIYIIKAGIPYSLFDLIARLSPFTMQDWSDFLNMSYKSLQRYKTNKSHFKQAQSERILELTEVMAMGEEVFDNTKQFRHWLHTENYALGKLTPMELLSSSYGKELVLTELVHIDEGIFV